MPCRSGRTNLRQISKVQSRAWMAIDGSNRSSHALRTTNALERMNEEFRRRVKTHGSLPSQDAVMLLLCGLLRSGQIRLLALVGITTWRG